MNIRNSNSMETQRLKQEFSQLYDGDPWIDVTLKQTLHEISTEKLLKKLLKAEILFGKSSIISLSGGA